ncbi:MAG: hypothetical protein ACODAU_13215 [Myxococcota bacterium]
MRSTEHHETTSSEGKVGVATGILGLSTAVATGIACVGPFVAILLGVGGFGWLTRYAHLRVPATLLTAAILGFGFYRVYGKRSGACAANAPTRRRLARVLLWSATVLAVGINVFEYVVLPRLG